LFAAGKAFVVSSSALLDVAFISILTWLQS